MKQFQVNPPVRGEGRFIKQSGPIGRFGHVVLEVECTGSTKALSVAWCASEQAIPSAFRGAVTRGIVRMFEPGAPFGEYRSEGVCVRVIDGMAHPTDSNDLSFEIAAATALKNALTAS